MLILCGRHLKSVVKKKRNYSIDVKVRTVIGILGVRLKYDLKEKPNKKQIVYYEVSLCLF